MAGSVRAGLVVVVVVVAGCTAPLESVSVYGEVLLDCDRGEVHRDAGITVAAASEDEVAGEALAEWIDAGATLVQHQPGTSWLAVSDGRRIAVAFPERNGDGSWVVHDVRICGKPDVGATPIDGHLDCASDLRWVQQGTIDPATPGSPTADGTLGEVLERYARLHDGVVVFVDDTTASLVVDDRERVVADAQNVPAGGWAVTTIAGCEGFQL